MTRGGELPAPSEAACPATRLYVPISLGPHARRPLPGLVQIRFAVFPVQILSAGMPASHGEAGTRPRVSRRGLVHVLRSSPVPVTRPQQTKRVGPAAPAEDCGTLSEGTFPSSLNHDGVGTRGCRAPGLPAPRQRPIDSCPSWGTLALPPICNEAKAVTATAVPTTGSFPVPSLFYVKRGRGQGGRHCHFRASWEQLRGPFPHVALCPSAGSAACGAAGLCAGLPGPRAPCSAPPPSGTRPSASPCR